MTKIYLYLYFIGALALASCGKNKITEGVIEFDITYPHLNTSRFMSMMMPVKMVMKFKDGKFKTIVSKGKTLETIFISDCRKKTLSTGVKIFKKHLAVEFSKKEIRGMLNEFPKVTYLDLKETDTLAGFKVMKKVAVFESVAYPEAEVWYTDEIELENANWCYPYYDIKGVLLQYELERYGLRMRLKANKFRAEEVDDKEFILPADYQRVPLSEFESTMKKMLNL